MHVLHSVAQGLVATFALIYAILGVSDRFNNYTVPLKSWQGLFAAATAVTAFGSVYYSALAFWGTNPSTVQAVTSPAKATTNGRSKSVNRGGDAHAISMAQERASASKPLVGGKGGFGSSSATVSVTLVQSYLIYYATMALLSIVLLSFSTFLLNYCSAAFIKTINSGFPTGAQAVASYAFTIKAEMLQTVVSAWIVSSVLFLASLLVRRNCASSMCS